MTAVWLAPLLLMPLVGAPLLLRTCFRRFPAGARLVLAGAAGAALTSFVMTLFALARWRWSLAAVAAGAMPLAWALSRLPAFAPAPPLGPASPSTPASRLAALVSSGAVAAAAFATSLAAATSPDLFNFWGTKAEQFAAARGIDVAYLQEPFHGFLHPYYPPLVTNLGALASMAAGRFSWEGAMATFPLLVAALAVALPGVLGGRRDRSGAASALAVSAIAIVGIRAFVAGNGDTPLVFFEALAMALLLRRDAGDPALQALAGLLFAGAATTKVEGLPFVLASAALFLALRARPFRSALAVTARLLGPTALALAAWFAFGVSRGLFHEYSEYGPFATLHLEHFPRVVAALAAALAGTAHGLPFLVPVICLFAAGRPPRASWLAIGTAAALVAFLLFAYLHMADDPRLWVTWSAARVLMPVPVLLALALSAGRAGGEPEPVVPSPH
ncbi:MAG TPA: hypothetical protein VMH79_08215 [Thermoanaerobaculia bacterium]|nr:hypothetical protein [Thermoanaerobaculia bacterium]